MKKLFTILLLCFAVFAAKAQDPSDCGTPITVFPYETDFSNEDMNACWTVLNSNGDDYQWTFSTLDSYASLHWNPSSAADDWLISPTFTLTGGEIVSFDYKAGLGIYPERFEVYVIQGENRTLVVNPVDVSNTSYESQLVDLSAFTGDYQIGIHGISDENMYYLYISNFKVAVPVASMSLSNDEIDFGTVFIDETADDSVKVSTLLVTDAVAVSTEAPFSVSLDGITYGTEVTITATTGLANVTTIYVRFAPTEMVEYNGTVICTVGDLTDTVFLAGEGFECTTISSFPYTTNFTNEAMNLCWTIVDANEDESTFQFDEDYEAAIYSYNEESNADDWLVSPEFVLTGSQYVAFDYYIDSQTYPEKFSVHLKQGTEEDIILVPTATYLNEEPLTMTIPLAEYTGTYQIAIHAESDADEDEFFITNFIVDDIENLDSSLTVNPEAVDFGNLIYAEDVTATETVSVSAIKIHGLTASVEAPFALSLDGATYTTTITLPDEDEIVNNTTLYVRIAPATFGSYAGTLTLTNGATTATVALSADFADCSEVSTLPFVEDFEDALTSCWQNIDNDGDSYAWEFYDSYSQYAHTGSGFATSASYLSNGWLGYSLTPDNWLISSAIAIPAEGAHISWWASSIDDEYYAEHYEVKISTDYSDLASFTNVYETTLTSDSWVQTTVDLMQYAGQTIYFAFVHNNCTDMHMLLLDDITIEAGSGIEEETVENQVFIYPNPASTMLNVHAENYRTVQIVNFLGQVVYSANVTENDFQINVSNLSNGVYFIRLNGETTTTQKFIKK